jgi:hypothetical protein
MMASRFISIYRFALLWTPVFYIGGFEDVDKYRGLQDVPSLTPPDILYVENMLKYISYALKSMTFSTYDGESL